MYNVFRTFATIVLHAGLCRLAAAVIDLHGWTAGEHGLVDIPPGTQLSPDLDHLWDLNGYVVTFSALQPQGWDVTCWHPDFWNNVRWNRKEINIPIHALDLVQKLDGNESQQAEDDRNLVLFRRGNDVQRTDPERHQLLAMTKQQRRDLRNRWAREAETTVRTYSTELPIPRPPAVRATPPTSPADGRPVYDRGATKRQEEAGRQKVPETERSRTRESVRTRPRRSHSTEGYRPTRKEIEEHKMLEEHWEAVRRFRRPRSESPRSNPTTSGSTAP